MTLKMGKETDFFIGAIANEKAQNKEIWESLLKEIILDYLQELNYFNKQNEKLIQKYSQENVETTLNPLKKNFDYSALEKLLILLNSGKDLLDNNFQIQKEKFDNYIMMTLDGEKTDLKKILVYAERKLKLNGIQKIHNYFQFIIAFYKIQNVRTHYIKKILIEKAEEQLNFETLSSNQEKNLIQNMSQLEKQKNYFVQTEF